MILPAILKVSLWALSPFLELRAAIPIGILVYKLNPVLVVAISVLTDIFLGLALLLALKPVNQWLALKSKFFSAVFNWSSLKAGQKTKKHLEKYGFIGLALFVGIPLPGTGVWTACLASYILGISFKKSFFAIGLGAFIAGIIVLLATLTGSGLEKYFGLEALLVILGILLTWFVLKKILLKRKN